LHNNLAKLRRTGWLAIFSALTILALGLTACGTNTPAASPTSTSSPSVTATAEPTETTGNFRVAFSDKPRSDYAGVPPSDLDELVDGNSRFAFDLYQQLASEDGNLFLSPHSISLALSMTYAGASGETEAEMRQALHFTLEQLRLHAAMNALDQQLAERGQNAPEAERFRLSIINSLWGQKNSKFEQPFLDTLAENYGAGMRLVDFIDSANREASRQTVNKWVEDNTEGRIKDLVPPDVLNDMTRLILVNAIYFKASWTRTFQEILTHDADFTLLDGSTASTSMMDTGSEWSFRYGDGDGYQAVELPYVGNSASMVVILPGDGQFEQFEDDLDAERLNEIIDGMSGESVRVSIPKFEFESEFRLSEALKSLGMEQAFEWPDADFSGMTGDKDLFIREVLHKAFVKVDEEGTEAAAATAVIMEPGSAPIKTYEFTADRPFIFLIRDTETGAILFLGRVLDPTA